MNKILNSKYGLLIFSLFSGLGYFLLILGLASGIEYSYLLALFFFPLIVCGAALYIFKRMRELAEKGETKKIRIMFIFHIVIFVFSCIFAYLSYASR